MEIFVKNEMRTKRELGMELLVALVVFALSIPLFILVINSTVNNSQRRTSNSSYSSVAVDEHGKNGTTLVLDEGTYYSSPGNFSGDLTPKNAKQRWKFKAQDQDQDHDHHHNNHSHTGVKGQPRAIGKLKNHNKHGQPNTIINETDLQKKPIM